MENRPVITLNGGSRYPGAEMELWERYHKWLYEVYMDLNLQLPHRRQIDSYHATRESPQYPWSLSVLYYDNYAGWEETRKSPLPIAQAKDNESWMKRQVMDFIWCAIYQLIKSYRSEGSISETQLDTRIENAPFLHIEAYRLKAEDAEKYNKWFIDYCSKVFIPLFMKQAGLKGYDYYQYRGISVNYPNLMEREYPMYLSAIHFENIEAFERFEKSNELAVCKRTMREIFPSGLVYQWYVQYQLVKSWRK